MIQSFLEDTGFDPTAFHILLKRKKFHNTLEEFKKNALLILTPFSHIQN